MSELKQCRPRTQPSRRRLGFESLLAAVLPLLCSTATLGQDRAPAIQPADIIEQFEIDPDDELLVVPVTIDGRVYPFILDTGTTWNAYDTTLKRHLGPSQEIVRVTTPSGVKTLELFDPPRAYLGRYNLRTSDGVTCLDLAPVRKASGHEFYGIVGMTFLLDRVINMNFAEGKVTFLRSNAPRAGTPVPLSIVREMPRVEVEFEGLGARSMLLDTGSVGVGCGELRSEDFDFMVRRGDLVLLGSGLGTDLSRQVRRRYGAVKQLTVAGERHPRLVFADHVNSDILGMGFWKRFNVTFDFPGHLVYLQKIPGFPPTDHPSHDLSGLHLTGKKGRIIVQGVNDGSPAALAGIRPGDFLLKLDGKDTGTVRILELRNQLGSAGKTVRLTLQRGDDVFEASLSLTQRRK